MKKIIFGTLNMNGGGASHNRQVQVKSLFDRKHLDVLLLQETHITEDVEYDWCRLFKGQCFFSNLSYSSAGVAFLFRPGLVPESCHFQEVIKGRFISLELVINHFHFTRFNVYAPSESVERRAFFLSLIRHLRSIDLNDCICMGVILIVP